MYNIIQIIGEFCGYIIDTDMDKLSDNDALIMTKALVLASKHFFTCQDFNCIHFDVSEAFAKLSEEALDTLFAYVTEGKLNCRKTK